MSVPPPPRRRQHRAPEFAGEDVTSELEELFDSTDTTIQKRLNAEKTIAARSLGSELETIADDRAGSRGLPVGDPTGRDAAWTA